MTGRQILAARHAGRYLPIKIKTPAMIARTAKSIDIGLGKGTSTLMP
jgi:hypothetical protein